MQIFNANKIAWCKQILEMYIFWKLQFECDPTSVMDAIIQVDEPQSCQYVITVLTSKICAIPHLRPPPVHKPVKIECRPLLTSTEYEKYQNYLKVSKENK